MGGQVALCHILIYFAYGNWCRYGVGFSRNLRRMVKRMAKRLLQPPQWPLQMRQPAVEVRWAVFICYFLTHFAQLIFRGPAAFLCFGGRQPRHLLHHGHDQNDLVCILSRFNFNVGHLCKKMGSSRHALIRQGNPQPVCLPQHHSQAE